MAAGAGIDMKDVPPEEMLREQIQNDVRAASKLIEQGAYATALEALRQAMSMLERLTYGYSSG